jgi:hypothetical protein
VLFRVLPDLSLLSLHPDLVSMRRQLKLNDPDAKYFDIEEKYKPPLEYPGPTPSLSS